MKRSAVVALLTAIMVIAGSMMCFANADELKLLSTYPENGQKNTSMENVGVKLKFNNPVHGENVRKINSKAIQLVDDEGKSVPKEVLFSDKNSGQVLVLADTSDYRVKNNSEYTVKVDAAFTDNNGNTLGKDENITFKTYNQKMNNYINMAMMVIMFGGIMVVTMKQQKDDAKEDKPSKGQDTTFNPYKEAKRTGKSVKEVIEEENKRQEKLAKKNKKKGTTAPSKKKEKIICADYLTNVYHVAAPAPIHKAKKNKKK